MATPDYKTLYEKMVKKMEQMEKKRDAWYAVEDAFFTLIEKRFDNEYYRELWNELEDIAHSHYTRVEISEDEMDRKLKKVDMDYYFPQGNNEEESEANYRKYVLGEDD